MVEGPLLGRKLEVNVWRTVREVHRLKEIEVKILFCSVLPDIR
jgi:hypothetical protein